MMKTKSNSLVEKLKPYVAMICLQFGYAGMNIVTKVSLNGGMSHYVLVVYRHAFATAVIAPFALILERKVRPAMTFRIFMQIFALGLLGPVIDQNFYYAGLKFTSPTYACALSNMLPAMTFVMALICRMENMDIKKVRCQAKVLGTLITVGGAMFMTLYKGHAINMGMSTHIHPAHSATSVESANHEWVMGSILVILATLAWAAFFILQAITMRTYTAHFSLTTLVCLLGTLQSLVVTLVMDHKASLLIGWNMNLFAAAYAGIISSGIAYYVQGLVMVKRGPVFVTAFSPLMMIIVAFMGSFILAEKIYAGGIIGAVLIVIGLYSVLWGKYKEYKDKEAEDMIPETTKSIANNTHTPTKIENLELEGVESQKKESGTLAVVESAVLIGVPVSPNMETPIKGQVV